ncbi:MAG TPA: site-2 protease family protein [Rectinemataceae bacterium]|nr:site-2 protease family protein [Rectinemataceae bacterium]
MTLVLDVILGLIGLGIVIFVHELGHFLAARAVGIGVEAFSLGWGPRLFSWKRGDTEYRISVFPIGGYCLMRGEAEFRQAIESRSSEIPRTPGTFHGASPLQRIIVSLAGPVANVIFAAIVFIAVAGVGYEVNTHGNRIVLASEYQLDRSVTSAPSYPADKAGLRTGDRIVAIDGKAVSDYYMIQEAITENSPGGKLGVFAWIDPIVTAVAPASSADLAGIKAGDKIVAVDGTPVDQAIAVMAALRNRPENTVFTIDRNGTRIEVPLILSWKDNGDSDLGISYGSVPHEVRSTSVVKAVGDGLAETVNTFSLTLRSLGIVVRHPTPHDMRLTVQRGDQTIDLVARPSFDDVNLVNSLSGPARITWIVGNTAVQGMGEGVASGLAKSFDLLAFLSIGLFIMNLLPIPALDGGQIVLWIVEGVRRKPLKAVTIWRFQIVGAILVLALFVLATASDVLWFNR